MGAAEVQAGFRAARNPGTDMWEHMVTLLEYAERCHRVVEFGVYDCTSTWALLAGRPSWMRSYDIIRRPEVDQVERAAEGSGTDFKFILASTTDVKIEPTDLLFIDTLHTYMQLRMELALHAGKVSRYILMHDTTTFGEVDQFGGTPGLWEAVREHLEARPEWKIRDRFTNCHGLTVLERVQPGVHAP
jgi:hypothetical protein